MDWFNIKSPAFVVRGITIKLWNLFNRNYVDGHWWGAGILQVGSRHLLYIGHDRMYIGFLKIRGDETV
jgi:hypothetical protein